MKKLLVIVVLALAAPSLAFGQAPTTQPPKPGAEVQKLGYWVGTWNYEGEAKASSFGPAGKVSGTDACEWFAGGFHVVCRSEATAPAGKMTALAIFAYDAAAKVYTYYGITSRGEIETSKATLAGGTWTWLWEAEMAGKPVKGRITVVEVSPTVYTYKMESSVAGGSWALVEEGKSSKVK